MTWADTTDERVPGGLVFVLYADDEIGLVQKIGPGECVRGATVRDSIVLSADYGAEQTLRWLREGKAVTLVVYDGDNGRAVFATRKVLSG